MNYNDTIKKLQHGINLTGKFHVMYNTNQFFSRQQNRPITMYSIKFAEFNEEKGKNEYTEVFKSARQLFIVLFLRNLLYSINGQEIVPEGENIPDYMRFNKEWKEFAEEFL